MDSNENNYEDEEKEARKKKKSRHRDDERRNKTRDDDEERKERRREKKSKKAEDGGEGDEEEEERRRRRRKERERLKQLEEQETSGKRDSDDHEKRTNHKNQDSKDESKLSTEVEGHGNSKSTIEPNKDRLSLDKPKTRPNINDDDDDGNFKIIKPSQRAKAEKEPVIEQKPFVNIWELAIKKMEEKENQMKEEKKEKSILFVGGKSAGKSSIIFRFLERPDEVPKPTVALEYLYAKRLKDNSYERETGHVWELGGGVRLSKIVESVIDENNLWTMRIALVVDLSKPEVMWVTLEKWLEVLRKKVDDVVKKMADSRSMKEKLIAKSKQRIGEDHQDLEMMDVFPLPILIIGTKYDIFQGFESEVRKIICKTLRFICHRNGASFQFCSNKHEGSMSRTRSFISNFLFETPLNPSNQVAHNKELSIMAGMDSFQEIGYPPVADGDTGRLGAKTPVDLWKYAFNKHFPQEDILRSPIDQDPTKDPQFKDAEIDALKAQKDAELARFLKTMDSKIKFDFNLTF